MKTQNHIQNFQCESAPTITTLTLSPPEETHQGAEDLYGTHDGAEGNALNDWPMPAKKNFRKATANVDLTIELYSEDGSHTQFYQSDEDSISRILGLLITPRLFTQPLLTLASENSVSTVPCRTVDMILVRTPTTPPLLLPPGWLDSVEVGAVAYHDEDVFQVARNAGKEDQTKEAEETTSFVEIHTVGDWMIVLKLRTAMQATIQDQRQVFAQIFDLPVIPFRLAAGGAGFINPPKISRVTVYPAFAGVIETGLPADLLRCIRS
jgi:hypothetical protein